MKKSTCLICLLLYGLPSTIWAQKPKSKPVQEASRSTAASADQLMREYHFNKAAQTLQREIASAQRANKSTERLEADLARANMGMDMLRGTEKVTFIDSIVVGRNKVLQTLKLSQEAGRLLPASKVVENMTMHPASMGKSAFVNELADRVTFSASDSLGKGKAIYMAFHSGEKWVSPTPLAGLDDPEYDRDYPFMMPDGSTIYFAAQGEESLGGYDIFVTRYDASSRRYLKPENVGMPFNSPANDYLMGIDETTGLGFFVTDRNQPADSACIYIFIPSATRDVYELTATNAEEVRRAAMISCIKDSQTDEATLKAARIRIEKAKASASQHSGQPHLYIIDDRTVYKKLSDFKSDAARRIAEQADEVSAQIKDLTSQQDALLKQAAQGKRTSQADEQLRHINQQLPLLKDNLKELCKNMRKAELGQ